MARYRPVALASLAALVLTLVPSACRPSQVTATPSPVPSPTVSSATVTASPTIAPLTGRTTSAQIEAWTGWEQLRAQDYTPDAGQVAAIRDRFGDTDVIVFLGTWCGDSKREVPRFFKILDEAGVSVDKIALYGLDRSKKDREGLTDKWGIQYVPTFIFVRNGREIGRIVEKPQGTLEGDIAQILGQ